MKAGTLAGCAVLAAAVVAPSVARAFPTGSQFDDDPIYGADYLPAGACDGTSTDPASCEGGGGVAFDGAPRFAGHTCAVCHVDAPGQVGLRLEADPPEIFTDGYQPNKTYKLRVVLQNQWAAAEYASAGDDCGPFAPDTYFPCDNNGFAMEIDDSIGRPLGKFAPLLGNGSCGTGTPPGDADVYVLKDGSAVVASGVHHGQVVWTLCWTAPAAGFGALTAYLAGVDGGGGDGTPDFPQDPYGDDVVAGSVPLLELGAPPPATQTGGCSATGGGGGGGGLALALGALFGVGLGRRRRRRRRRRGVAGLLAVAILALAAGGCVHVRPSQRETLAERKMKFAPDPTEDELDLHMQEAREGLSGGYGSAGGGCGCN